MIKYNTRDLYRFYRSNRGTLSYDLFKQVISLFNQKISKEIIKGYHFRLPHKLGILKIMQFERGVVRVKENGVVCGVIDWKASNGNKASILLEGKLPYESIKDETGKIIGNNDGEKWLIYRTDTTYYRWVWVPDVLLHNSVYYRLDATWHNDRALVAAIDENSELIFEKAKKDYDRKSFSNMITNLEEIKNDKQEEICNQ